MTIGDIERSPAAVEAERAGLSPIGRQPSLISYVRSVWERRYFLAAFARSRLAADSSESRLGQLWQVLNPLLNAGVYYLIFAVILKTTNSIQNYVPFLITGVFIFGFTQRVIQSGAKSITGNLGLVRALHFPRAVLPLSTVLEELLKTGTSLVVLSVIVLAYGEPLTWAWLQLPAVIGLQLLFSAGIALIFARLTTSIRDVAQFLPFAMRIWMYLSGVMYSIPAFVSRHDGHEWAVVLLQINPAAVYIQLARGSLMKSAPAAVTDWYLGIAWAVVAFVVGFIFFWRAESSYGRG
jgi:teichoic acid transport system permease protein